MCIIIIIIIIIIVIIIIIIIMLSWYNCHSYVTPLYILDKHA